MAHIRFVRQKNHFLLLFSWKSINQSIMIWMIGWKTGSIVIQKYLYIFYFDFELN